MNHFAIALTLLLLLSSHSHAASYSGLQGDVLRVPAPFNHDNKVKFVEAFGKKWPVFNQNQQQVAWVGIHLDVKPGKHILIWHSENQTATDEIVVGKGNFRISHIKVAKKMSSFDEEALKRIKADAQAVRKAYATKTNFSNWPEMIQPTPGEITTPFGAQRYVNGNPRSPHSGIDIAAITGTPVKAPMDGKVLLVADMFLNGKLLAIGHGNGITTVYAHLNSFAVKEGDQVKQGEVIATVGSTGRSTGPHLHWGVQFNGGKVNPASMLKSHER